MSIPSPADQWRSQPKNLGGPKCLILGEEHYFVWKNASQSTKWLYFLKIRGVAWSLSPPPDYAYAADSRCERIVLLFLSVA